MRLYRLDDATVEWLARQPETFMGVQVATLQDARSGELIFILGGQIALRLGEEADEASENLIGEPWYSPSVKSNEGRSALFLSWRQKLESLPAATPNSLSILSRSGFTLHPGGIFPPAPPVPPRLYGHLPFVGATDPSDVFYRWEPWPTSRRVNPVTLDVARDTYTAPRSETPFAPTGFAAVGRFALPNLAPACFRWELQPPAGTKFRCGASVPLYGQAGGGVEAAFPSGFHNAGPIANPVVLSAL